MLIAFELSGEHETLPESEVLACMRALGIDHRIVKSREQFLMLDVSGEPSQILSTRLAMTHHIISVILECDPSESSIIESVRDSLITIPEGETFSVRTRQLTSTPLSSALTERLVGGIIFERNKVNGVKVNLTTPDHRFRVVITEDSCVFGEVLASIDRRQFEERKPHKKPFFHPGAISPGVARAIVNICEIRSGDLVLDPFCGTGGILVEAGHVGARVIGIDVQQSMIRGAEMNLRSQGFEYQLLYGDACNLPFADRSIDAVVTDPPYGRSAVVIAESVESLYRNALLELHRVIVNGGHAIVISDFKIPWAEDIGFTVAELHTQRVHRSLTRYIMALCK